MKKRKIKRKSLDGIVVNVSIPTHKYEEGDPKKETRINLHSLLLSSEEINKSSKVNSNENSTRYFD